MNHKLLKKILCLMLVLTNLLFNPLFLLQSLANEHREIISLRTESSKTFIIDKFNNQNVYQQIQYADKVHFLQNGKWRDVNNNIVQIDKNSYRNSSNDFNFTVKRNINDGVEYKRKEDYCKIKLEPIDDALFENINVEVFQNKAIYQLSENLKLEYTVLSTGVRTEVVVSEGAKTPEKIVFDVTDCNTEIFDEAIMFDNSSQAKVKQEIVDIGNEIKLLLTPNYQILGEINGELRIDPSINTGVTKDTFVSTTTPYGNGSRRFLAIGTYYDSTVDALFPKSKTLINFTNLNIPNSAVIVNSELEVYHYGTNANNGGFYVSKITEDWEENESWPGPATSGDFGSVTFPHFNTNSSAVKRTVELDAEVVDALKTNQYGLSLQNYDENTNGVVICSKEIPSGPCLDGMEPKLIITYSLGSVPKTPELGKPDDNWTLGPNENYENVVCSQAGIGLGCNVGFNAKAEDVEDSLPLETIIEITNESGEKVFKNHFQETSGWFEEFIQITDGNWSWRAKSVNKYGNESDWSATKHFLVDTTAPTVPVVIEEPLFTKGTTNYVKTNLSNDLSIIIKYNFESSLSSDFQVITKQSGWTSVNYYTFPSLVNDKTYYYRVKATDTYGNESRYSEVTFSTQDSRGPSFNDIVLSAKVISPANEDGNLDHSEISANVTDINWKSNYFRIYNSRRQIVLEKELFGQDFEQIIDGKDNNGDWLPDGVYKIELISHDLAGNITVIGGPSAPSKYDHYFLFVIDNTAGILNISYPESGAWFQDNVKITGITGINSIVNIKNKSTNDSFIPVVNSEIGVFEQEIDLIEGENEIEVKAIDQHGNIVVKNLTIYSDITNPEIVNVSPTGLTNNDKPEIKVSLNDLGLEDFASGINAESLYLSMFGTVGTDYQSVPNEIVLVNEGINVSDFGHLESDCEFAGIYGLSKAEDCEIKYIFEKPIQPDGKYEIYVQIKDISGNEAESSELFEIDTKTFLEVDKPVSEELFNHSFINIEGFAEAGANVEIWNNGELKLSFINSEEQGNPDINVLCGEDATVRRSFSEDGCGFKIDSFQLNANPEIEQIVENNLLLKVLDTTGNIERKELIVRTNLFSVNLSIDTNLEYFSPNGDGKQDGVNFVEMETDGEVQSWLLEIKDAEETVIKEFSGIEVLPESIYWDGLDSQGTKIVDGDYSYSLEIITTDGVEIKTEEKLLYARSQIDDGVIITSPKNNSVTTKGVVSIYGLAPSESLVRICVDVIGMNGSCNLEFEAESRSDGTFSLIVPLIRLPESSQTENVISAWAIDKYGNQSEVSNSAKVIVDTIDPFISISALPTITGVNKEEDYQKLLEKIENGTVTKDDIDRLKTVILRSTVSANTEWINFEFADFTNLSELPDDYDYEQIGWIDGENESHYFSTPLLAPPAGIRGDQGGLIEAEKNCKDAQCTWDFYYPVPPVIGGIYEIVYTGKKAETVEKMSASIIIDGTLPLAPTILNIRKVKEKQETEGLTIFENSYYSNSKNIEIVGVSDPSVEIKVLAEDESLICETETNEIGIFYCTADLEELHTNSDFEVKLKVKANDGLNIVESIEDVNLVIDQTAPDVTSKKVSPEYAQSGTVAEFEIVSNEILKYAIVDNGKYIEDLILSNNYKTAIGEIYIDPEQTEGVFTSYAKIVDLAGNKSIVNIEVIIDNTAPEKTVIETQNWGESGINYKTGIPAVNRLGGGFVASDSTIEITGLAEENSEVEVFVNGKMGDTVKCVAGKWNYSLNFSQEGGYTISTRVVDRAGNKSEFSESVTIYYDKTPPAKLDILNLAETTYEKSVSFNIETEAYADLKIEIVNSVGEKVHDEVLQNSANGITSIEANIGESIGEYKVKITAYDSAGNSKVAEKTFQKLEIPKIITNNNEQQTTPNGQPSSGNILGLFENQWSKEQQEKDTKIKGASLSDPYAGQSGDKLSSAWLNVNIKYDGTYNVESYSVPTPTLTMIDIESNSGNIYGVATPKNQKMSINYNFYFATFNEAKSLCGIANWKSVGMIFGSEKDCIEQKMGIDNLRTWYAGQSAICSLVPITALFCVNNKLNNWRTEKSGSIETQAQHVLVSFYKNEESNSFSGVWNDSADGRFAKNIQMPADISIGDKVRAKTSIFGDFEISGVKVDYRLGDGKGLQSGLSSALTVGAPRVIPDFIEPQGDDAICKGTHNPNKQYSVAEAAILLGDMLTQRTTDKKYYSKFKCASPDCAYIPQKAKDVYTLSNYWNPKVYSNTYVQCIAFVYMAYNLGGNPINKVTGNAIAMAGKQWNCGKYEKNDEGKDVCVNWYLGGNSGYASQFDVYKSGETDVMPKIGDVMVWEQSPPNGHVGVVTGIKGDSIFVTNANSNNVTHTFKVVSKDGSYKIFLKNGSSDGWKPDYWARKK